MFWIELVILLVLIAWGVRKGSVFLTLAGGFGAFIFTFLFKAPMSDPPMTVLRIIMCVVIAGGAMQAAGGIEYLVALAEKIMRKYPKSITIVAPLVSWVFVFCCGTGHILWSLLPIINEIAIENASVPSAPSLHPLFPVRTPSAAPLWLLLPLHWLASWKLPAALI